MKRKRKELSRQYLAALQKHLTNGPRANARPAERLGRQALSAGLGTLDLAKIHEHALIELLTPKSSLVSNNGKVTQATVFFVEALAPIEKTRRAAVESNERLNRVNVSLSRRTVDLVAANRQLQQEMIQRRVVEKALKQSEQHYNHLLEESLHLQEQLRRVSHQILSAHEQALPAKQPVPPPTNPAQPERHHRTVRSR
jgi:hypothetical protein